MMAMCQNCCSVNSEAISKIITVCFETLLKCTVTQTTTITRASHASSYIFFHLESTRISKVVNKLTIFIVIECHDILKKSIYLIKLMPLTQKGVCCVCVWNNKRYCWVYCNKILIQISGFSLVVTKIHCPGTLNHHALYLLYVYYYYNRQIPG